MGSSGHTVNGPGCRSVSDPGRIQSQPGCLVCLQLAVSVYPPENIHPLGAADPAQEGLCTPQGPVGHYSYLAQ